MAVTRCCNNNRARAMRAACAVNQSADVRITPTCVLKECELKERIIQCEFILVDINLYLDTHSTDEEALADYNCYAEQLRALKDMYVENYGPLMNFGNSLSEGEWGWTNDNWPWSNRGCKGV